MANVQPAYPMNYYAPERIARPYRAHAPRHGGAAAGADGLRPAQPFGGALKNSECSGSDNQDRKRIVTSLAQATALFGVGMLLHRLPVRLPGDGFKTIVPSDWKVWARVILGIAATQKVNQAFGWQPPPWLGALQAVAIINPLAAGFTLNNLKQTAVMAPLVAAVVQGASEAQKKLSGPLQEEWDISPPVTRLGLSAALGVGAMLLYPRFYKAVATSGLLGQALKKQAAQTPSALASATFSNCARGCSPGSFICLSELADIGGSFGSWFHSAEAKQSADADGKRHVPERGRYPGVLT